MRNPTRKLFNAYVSRIAELNGVDSAATSFSVAPTVQQTLEAIMQESSAFLRSINVIGVDNQAGAKVGVGVTGPTASRTNTAAGVARKPRNVAALSEDGYRCVQTNFDSEIKYAQLDAWAHNPAFQTLLRDAILQRQALDRITIGFNGTSIAATTDIAANPLLQDVNKGWLQKYREYAPGRVMGSAANPITVGSAQGADYKNLDAVVYDALASLDPWRRGDPGIIVLVGDKLMHDKYFPLVNKDHDPTEALAADMVMSQKRVGGKQAVTVPFFPENALMVTSLKNLSLYYQNGARRRHVKDAPELDAIQNFESSNEDYVIEDYGFGAVVEHIELV